MRLISMEDMAKSALNFSDPEVFPEAWESRRIFSQYRNLPRPCHALFLVCTDLNVYFTPENGQTVSAKKGDVVYIPRRSRYFVTVEGGAPDGIDTYTVNFTMRDNEGEYLTLSEQICVLCNDRNGALHLHFQKLSETAHSGDGHCNFLRLRTEFYAMLCAVVAAQTPGNSYYAIREGVEALRSEWNRNAKMEKYAALCGVSETYFYRCFREWVGKSPVEYRNDLRLSHAEAMLRHTDMPVSEIAAVVGFEDPFYFSRTFSGRFGLSPRAYRAAARRD